MFKLYHVQKQIYCLQGHNVLQLLSVILSEERNSSRPFK